MFRLAFIAMSSYICYDMNMKSMRVAVVALFVFGIAFFSQQASAQTRRPVNVALPTIIEATSEAGLSTESGVASISAEEQAKLEKRKESDVTQPEEAQQKAEFFALFATRPANKLSWTNFAAFGVQYAVSVGIPANTVMLILMLPILATMLAFVRHVIGLPSLGMIVPIALSITFLATGLTTGLVLLLAIILGSTLAKILLKKIRIMQLPKMAISMLIVSLLIFITLTLSATAGIIAVKQISIFPLLLLILLSESIVTLQMERTTRETLTITGMTLILGVAGYLILSWEFLRNVILLYPELILLLIPINIVIGRYFGLRLTEMARFSPVKKHGS
jgi:hypothetical protein